MIIIINLNFHSKTSKMDQSNILLFLNNFYLSRYLISALKQLGARPTAQSQMETSSRLTPSEVCVRSAVITEEQRSSSFWQDRPGWTQSGRSFSPAAGETTDQAESGHSKERSQCCSPCWLARMTTTAEFTHPKLVGINIRPSISSKQCIMTLTCTED